MQTARTLHGVAGASTSRADCAGLAHAMPALSRVMPALPGIINDVLIGVDVHHTCSHRLIGLCHMLPSMVHATGGTPQVCNLFVCMARLPLTELWTALGNLAA